jgi:hypothetical protein
VEAPTPAAASASWAVVGERAAAAASSAPGFRTVGSWQVVSGTPGELPASTDENEPVPELQHQRLQNLLSYAGLVSALIMLLIGVLLMLANRPL